MMLTDFVTLLHYSPVVNDGGPIYHEFHEHDWIKEPWNAFSSLFFLVPVFYWIWKLRGQYKRHIIITAILPLLFLNGVGSTMYHAFRAHQFWLTLDFLPALVMMLVLGTYFWTKITGTWKKGILVIPISIGLITALFYAMREGVIDIPDNSAPNIIYTINGLNFIGIPVFILLRRTNFYKWHLMAWTAVFLIGAVTFRSLDYPTDNPFPDLMPQGTHFLWHVISAFAVFSLGWYLYHLREFELNGGALDKKKSNTGRE